MRVNRIAVTVTLAGSFALGAAGVAAAAPVTGHAPGQRPGVQQPAGPESGTEQAKPKPSDDQGMGGMGQSAPQQKPAASQQDPMAQHKLPKPPAPGEKPSGQQKPAEQQQPAKPSKPSDAAQEQQHAKPSKPSEPGKPSEPAQPAEPAEPTKPAAQQPPQEQAPGKPGLGQTGQPQSPAQQLVKPATPAAGR
ncbi:hypothetical protein [Streptomyces qinglanensis]|uniref:hypothetical protein n=1 Tax=Streptomyces qinglanensis TaxID=943816 RepID=UPI003D72F290